MCETWPLFLKHKVPYNGLSTAKEKEAGGSPRARDHMVVGWQLKRNELIHTHRGQPVTLHNQVSGNCEIERNCLEGVTCIERELSENYPRNKGNQETRAVRVQAMYACKAAC